jgi:hypothetical protein
LGFEGFNFRQGLAAAFIQDQHFINPRFVAASASRQPLLHFGGVFADIFNIQHGRDYRNDPGEGKPREESRPENPALSAQIQINVSSSKSEPGRPLTNRAPILRRASARFPLAKGGRRF